MEVQLTALQEAPLPNNNNEPDPPEELNLMDNNTNNNNNPIPDNNESSTNNTSTENNDDEEINLALFDEYEEDEFGNQIIKKKDNNDKDDKKDEEVKPPEPTVPFFTLFSFASPIDRFILIIATIGSIAQGASMPLLSLYLGNLINDLNNTNFSAKVEEVCIFFAILALAAGFGGFLSVGGFMYTAEKSGKALRNRYLRGLLRQDISWFDTNSVGDVSSRLTAYSRKYQDGIGEKMGIVIGNLATFVIGLVVAFYRGWELTLILLAPAPIMIIITGIFASLVAQSSTSELGKYATANSIALQTFDSIRTVVSYQMEPFLLSKYSKYSKVAYQDGKKKGYQVGTGIGFFFFIIFSMYALGLFYGGYLIKSGRLTWPGGPVYTGGSVLSIFYSLLTAVMMLGQSATNFSAIASARSALASILEVMQRNSEINPYPNALDNIESLHIDSKCFTGGISFQNVSFRYPTRLEALVLDQFTYTFEPHSALALSGPSGCGKTSIMQLIERFYDPCSGNIFIEIDLDQLNRTLSETNRTFDPIEYATRYDDIPKVQSYQLHTQFANGQIINTTPRSNTQPLPPNTTWVNLKDISVSLWRKDCVGLVNQQPVLFNGTIIDNLRFANPNATEAEIEAVAKQCNCHDFIMQKPRGYHTEVGENGSLLSGGQKQRISLARTLLSPRKLLLLDEITSQCDSISEKSIQTTLDQLIASNTFSSISIAHRLSTIKDSDIIIVMRDGKIVETGTHDELLALTDGVYFGLITVNNENKKTIAISELEEDAEDIELSSDSDNDDIIDDGILVEHNNNDDNNNNNTDTNDTTTQQQTNDHHHDPISSKRFSTTIKSSLRHYDDNGKKIKHQKKSKYRQQNLKTGYFRRYLWQSFSNYWPYYIIGAIFGAGEGASFPIYSWLMSKILRYYYLEDKAEMYRQVSNLTPWFVLLGVGAGICGALKISFLTIPAERMIYFFRVKVFENLMYQEIGFHDDQNNSSSILTTKLAADTSYAREITAGILGMLISVSVNVGAAFVISFINSWRMTLVMLIVFPILSACGVVQFKLLTGFGAKSKRYIEKAGLVAVEGLRNIRVVSSFNAEDLLYQRFASKQGRIVSIGVRASMFAGAGFGATQFFMFGSYALSFWFGSWLVQRNYLTFEKMMSVFLMIEMASMMFGQFLSQISTIDKARAAFIDLYTLLDRKSLYDTRIQEGENHDIPVGAIEFKNVHFHYPTAPLLPVLRGVSFTVDPTQDLPLLTDVPQDPELIKDADPTIEKTDGQRDCYLIGIVGGSGQGKSTIASQLLPMFYRTVQPGGDESFILPKDSATPEEIKLAEERHKVHKEELERKLKKRLHLMPRDGAKAGQILIDGNNVDTFNLSHLRKYVSLVAQDTVLFHGTIKENIIAGDETITEEDMIHAAKVAHIHHIICKLPKGYNTLLTSNNALSGGQRARIGIARAVARSKLAKIIILDESTAAISVREARIIQHNLRVALKDKILFFIAHRLETVRYAQKILVLEGGLIAENGTHEELFKLDGIYANLVRLQQ